MAFQIKITSLTWIFLEKSNVVDQNTDELRLNITNTMPPTPCNIVVRILHERLDTVHIFATDGGTFLQQKKPGAGYPGAGVGPTQYNYQREINVQPCVKKLGNLFSHMLKKR